MPFTASHKKWRHTCSWVVKAQLERSNPWLLVHLPSSCHLQGFCLWAKFYLILQTVTFECLVGRQCCHLQHGTRSEDTCALELSKHKSRDQTLDCRYVCPPAAIYKAFVCEQNSIWKLVTNCLNIRAKHLKMIVLLQGLGFKRAGKVTS